METIIDLERIAAAHWRGTEEVPTLLDSAAQARSPA
jgi:hypothetical protein